MVKKKNKKRLLGALCCWCLEENLYQKPETNGKVVCAKCNKFIPDDFIIRLPFEMLQERKSLIILNKYQHKLQEFKDKIKEKGKVGEIYVEINMEV